MKENRLNLSWWWGFIIIGECFISSNVGSTTNRGIRDLPYWEFDFKIVLLAILMIMFFGTILQKGISNRNIMVDNISLLLLARIALSFIPSLYMAEQYYWGNIISYAVAPIVYLIIINRKIRLKSILPFVKVFAIVSTTQCVVLFISSPVPYTDTLYKYYFVSPVGASNYLGCIMVIAFTVILYCNSGKRKWFWFLLGLVGIFFTKSRTSLFTYILIPCLDAFITVVKKGTISAKAMQRTCIVGLLFLVLGIVFAGGQIGSTIQELVDSMIRGFTSSGSDFTSGRVDQFINQLLIASKYPLFGAGFTFGDSYGSMHNFILESFYVSGIFGLFVQIALLVYIYKCVKSPNKKMGWILIAAFMVSLFEKVLFTTIGEFILWSLVGIIYNEKAKPKQQVPE